MPLTISPVQSSSVTVDTSYDVWVFDMLASTLTSTLVSAVGLAGRTIYVAPAPGKAKNVLTVNAQPGELIRNGTSLAAGGGTGFTSDGANWMVL